jgi:hypothetical protein
VSKSKEPNIQKNKSNIKRDDEGRFPSYAEIEIEKMSNKNKK